MDYLCTWLCYIRQTAKSNYFLHKLNMLVDFEMFKIVWSKMFFSCSTQQKMNNLFWRNEKSHEQCFAAHIVQGCQQYCSTLLHLTAG